MAFNIKLTDGSSLTTVEDGTIDDTTCSLTLIGKNYVGYGTLYNENIVLKGKTGLIDGYNKSKFCSTKHLVYSPYTVIVV